MIMPSFTITQEEKEENTATFIFEPLEQGYGHTLGNALRRAMLDSLTGAAITQVKIKGIRHQFSTLKGMSEDVVEFILNLKRIRVRYDGDEPQTLRLEAQGPGEIKASQIKAPPMVSIINKDQILGTLANKKVGLEAELQVERGTGYSSAEERKSNQIGVIPIDATFTPVLQVSYHVEATRVGGRTDLDRLILKVITDGTLKPTEALHQTAKLLEAYFRQVYEPKVKAEKPQVEDVAASEIYKLTVEELDLSTRIANALRKGGYRTVADLVEAPEKDIAKVKNLGEKSVEIIRKALKKKDVSLRE
ncbi:MAG: DNA-directed RNA polymerase subunit alpha [Candidatus Chisholmbacteria bacterium RIFCSPHIGHO2_12_FULL_49_9]|uniref:DNA-directed RNA polymerase subunit alpha n=1 Tax=Candidatus Chisholmbacteria bacterium RIFCSPHIGHO2_01_FULL_52_32 TaxID=1797591 RepID=A0A1G1VTV0_9BACT|nr:MAG: DNA-directed RNA polymerase subunit alpha [Candidatus Chisholmbacteria bacterium RIFCSPHIGHO2_01_FULL_52_32]OGY19241.1 MAG: DNA-directed RNA polymerase subunit alpha [Candidatus Chisholmbacteria bacterium RIFCSPHIGHO2_12_FULL_49_9]OGY19802.1 MAG: DNA-directed RNA polymerase subunit alpha [Candidatus Chisholmbacteria bacterium RIFCSPLOWO2_01_FULL_50_28]